MNPQTPLPLEDAWQTLRVNLEWVQAFGLIFVFCSDVRAKEALFRRADDLMRTQVRPFERPEKHLASRCRQSVIDFRQDGHAALA